MSSSSHPLSVRFPAPLRGQLSRRATAEHRTVSNLIVTLVATALDARAEHMPTEDDAMRMFAETFEVTDGVRR